MPLRETLGSFERNFMNPPWSVIVLLITSSLSVAQLSVENPKHLDYPEAKAKVLLSTACRVVAEEFHAHNPI